MLPSNLIERTSYLDLPCQALRTFVILFSPFRIQPDTSLQNKSNPTALACVQKPDTAPMKPGTHLQEAGREKFKRTSLSGLHPYRKEVNLLADETLAAKSQHLY